MGLEIAVTRRDQTRVARVHDRQQFVNKFNCTVNIYFPPFMRSVVTVVHAVIYVVTTYV